jgi:alanine racemase
MSTRPENPSPPASQARAWVEVDPSALRRNLERVAAVTGADTGLIPMVKADAYGLGAAGVVRALSSSESRPVPPVAAWGVATVDEGVALRAAGVAEAIHVYSPLTPDDLRRAVAAGLVPTLSMPHEFDALLQADRPAAFQIEIDTGMGRAGAPRAMWSTWREKLTRAGVTRRTPLETEAAAPQSHGLSWAGVFTHFHSADEAEGPGMSQQLAAFHEALALLDPPEDVRVHIANSAAALRWAGQVPLGAARAGIFLYGGAPGPDLAPPEPVAHVRARVVRVVDVLPGTSCGYGATYQAQSQERWATLAIGYGDGLPRALGNCGSALVHGQRAPIIGRVSMDLTVINISGLDGVRPGDVATLLGCDGEACISLSEVADLAGTISYEILTGLGARLPRVWLDLTP